MKNWKRLLLALLSAGMLLALLAGCSGPTGSQTVPGIISVANSPEGTVGSQNRTPLDEVGNFTFDFETLAYSFAGANNAEFYYIRVFPVVDGKESNSASFQSDKIDANSENTYSGTVQGQALLAGDYVAHVVASAAGYSSSDAQVSGTSKMQGNPTLAANWNTGSSGGSSGEPEPDPGAEPTPVTVDITITPADETITRDYTLVIVNKAGTEVYRNDHAAAGSMNLVAADLGAEELSTGDEYTVTVTVNQVSGYTAPAQGVTSPISERRFGPPM